MRDELIELQQRAKANPCPVPSHDPAMVSMVLVGGRTEVVGLSLNA